MSNYRSRGYSPPRSYHDQPRASTGMVYATTFDAPSRGNSLPQSRASVSTVSSGRHSVTYQAQPMRKSTFADGKTKTEYAIRPKTDQFIATDPKRPLSLATRNVSPPRRNSMLTASPREATPTTIRDDSTRLLHPGSMQGHHHGFHQRHNSTSTSTADLEPRNSSVTKRDKPHHRIRAPYVQKVYHDHRPPPRDEEQWSYTGPREQFARDYPQQPSGRRESVSRKERPSDYHEVDRPTIKRDLAPPPASLSKQLVKHDRASAGQYAARSGFDSDPDHGSEAPKRRHSTRPPVLHQQLTRDDGYSSARDDYDLRKQPRHRSSRYDDNLRPREHQRESARHYHDKVNHVSDHSERDIEYGRSPRKDAERERHHYHDRGYGQEERVSDNRRNKPRSRDSSPERAGLKSLATGALGSLAAVGVVKGLSRDHKDKDPELEDDEDRDQRRRRRRHRSETDDRPGKDGVENGRYGDERRRPRPQESSSSDTPDTEGPRRHSRRRHAEAEKPSNGELLVDTEQSTRSASRVRTRDQDQSPSGENRSSRDLVRTRQQDKDLDAATYDGRDISQDEDEDDQPRRLQLVEPLLEKDEVKPRGILKPARQVPFPEDPNPIREGVAPLKDATKNGIPPNARWTKISRVLVNPEALEKAHERFEEREDYVIVLRVIQKDEIERLAAKTKEIRDAREREWQQKLAEQKQSRRSDDENDSIRSDADINYDNNHEGPTPRLAIEQGPTAPPADLHNLQQRSSQPIAYAGIPGGLPIPGINVEATYSQNV